MNFCPACESKLTKSTTTAGTIIFQCQCALIINGTDTDTLMMEKYINADENMSKHQVMISNAPYDLAGNRVMKDCPKCGLNYMTMLRIGPNQTTAYSCKCGYSS